MFLQLRNILFLWLTCLVNLSLFSSDVHEEAFTRIYDHATWGRNSEGRGYSGGGSLVSNAQPYMDFVEDFIKQHNIKTVVDVGCGDWEFSRHMDWNGVTYTGYDVVKSVIERDIQRFGSPTVRFVHANFLKEDLPQADLLLCKDVLQHLSNNDILLFIPQLTKYRFCLITNETTPGSFTGDNADIRPGGGRKLDLSKPPFFLNGRKVLNYSYSNSHGGRRADFKQIFLIEMTQKRPILSNSR